MTNYCLPLTLGSGSVILSVFPSAYLSGHISNYIMFSSIFAKIALLTISMNSGFIGGFIFPMITIATMCGLIMNNTYPSVPLGMTFACFMAVSVCVCLLQCSNISFSASKIYSIFTSYFIYIMIIISYIFISYIITKKTDTLYTKQNINIIIYISIIIIYI